MCPTFVRSARKVWGNFLTITWEIRHVVCARVVKTQLFGCFSTNVRSCLMANQENVTCGSRIQFERVLAAKLGSGISRGSFGPGGNDSHGYNQYWIPDESFDVIIAVMFGACYKWHDGHAGIRTRVEARRMAVILVLLRLTNFEDPSVIDQRTDCVFWPEDHVRIYGPDFVERLKSAGWRCKKFFFRLLDHRRNRPVNITQLSGMCFTALNVRLIPYLVGRYLRMTISVMITTKNRVEDLAGRAGVVSA